MKHLHPPELEHLLDRIAEDYRLLVPQTLEDGTRLLRPRGEGFLDLFGGPPQRKPTESFLPQYDPLLRIACSGEVSLEPIAAKPLCLFGLHRADLQCLAFVDRFNASPPQDDRYQQKRRNALLVGLSGYCGNNRELLPLADELCDFELVANGEGWLAQSYTARGADLLEPYCDHDPQALEEIRRLSRAQGTAERATLEQAARLVQQNLVPDSFWEEVGSRCILCSGCNLVCPTCTCFCVEDRSGPTGVERSRVWDSCQFDSFMREASGHNPLGTEALRTRRRIHHKLAADIERWGEISCFLCGRCDKTCPTGIGIQAVAAEIFKRFG